MDRDVSKHISPQMEQLIAPVLESMRKKENSSELYKGVTLTTQTSKEF